MGQNVDRKWKWERGRGLGVLSTARSGCSGGLRRAVVASLCTGLLAFAPAASALPDQPFTPELAVSPATTQAGAHSDLTIEMHKPINHCPNYSGLCSSSSVYMEQDLKKMVTHFPAGLVADANAAPYCNAFQGWMPMFGSVEKLTWMCENPESMVGSVFIRIAGCDPNKPQSFPLVACAVTNPQSGAFIEAPGVVYNEEPGPGEQGHLVIFWMGAPEAPNMYGNFIRSDVSITVDEDVTMHAVADNIPDYYQQTIRIGGGPPQQMVATAAQAADIELTLVGSTGGGEGHPLLTAPTVCDPQALEAEFQGYANNAVDRPVGPILGPGSGDGKTVPDSAPYQATDCDSVPYDPKLTMSLDATGPEAAPAISSTVTQEDGEASTEKVKVAFPDAFKINMANTGTHCPEADLAAKTCPESSKVGTVTAESRLLPIGQKLEGNVYLAGLTSDSVKLSAFLTGFIDLRIDAEGAIASNGSITTTFDDLPAVPISRFELNLLGGEKGLLKTPKVCGPYTVTSEFESHSGKTKQNTQDFQFAGCADPALDVDLSTKRPGRPVDLDLALGSTGTAIDTVELRLARQLGWGKRKGRGASAAKKKALRSIGLATFTTKQGEQKVRIEAKKTKRGNLALVPLQRKTSQGQLVATQVPSFAATLFRTAQRQPALAKRSKGKTGKKARRQTDLALSGFPEDQLTRMELSLRGADRRRSFFLKTPTGCKKPLNFVAIVTTTDGRKLVAKDEVKLKGRGC